MQVAEDKSVMLIRDWMRKGNCRRVLCRDFVAGRDFGSRASPSAEFELPGVVGMGYAEFQLILPERYCQRVPLALTTTYRREQAVFSLLYLARGRGRPGQTVSAFKKATLSRVISIFSSTR